MYKYLLLGISVKYEPMSLISTELYDNAMVYFWAFS